MPRNILLLALCPALLAAQTVEVRPADNGAALSNPGMGWVLHHYDNSITNYGSRLAPEDTVDEFPGVQVIYLRLAWSYLEPEEGRFNWSIVDAPAQRWIARGKQVAFRITASESGLAYATPKWVEQAGAKGYRFTPGKGEDPNGRCWEPDYNDPVFLSKLENFLKAAAARYDGSPEVAFIDVGSFGVWGEGHTESSTRRPYDAATVIRHLELHARYFRKTLLAANDDFVDKGRGPASIARAQELGMTLRDDSILVQPPPKSWFHAAMAQPFWPRVPVVLESEHYGSSVKRNAWGDGSLYLKAIEEYHASYASVHWWPREFLAEMRPLVDRINLRLGYRLNLVSAAWPAEVRQGQPFDVKWSWRNAGVAPLLPGGFPALTLTNAKGGIVAVWAGASDLGTLPVAAPGAAPAVEQTERWMVPENVAPGRYDAWVSVGSKTGTPAVALPYADSDGHRRYRLGAMTVGRQ
jgi:hypothetical protein